MTEERIPLVDHEQRIYQREVSGRFQRLRVFGNAALLLAFFVTPWLMWNQRQLVWFDLPERQFHVFHMTFWPQDLFLLGLLLIVSAFGLFLVTVWAGRVWCGYTCPQTVWTQMFVWLETRFEGQRHQRIRRDKNPTLLENRARKAGKHVSWMALAWLTGFTFVGYFTPIRELLFDFFSGQAALSAYVWIFIFSALTYTNAGWMREKVCIYMCPYARFQSAMFDPDTLIVSYDKARGEPRGKAKSEPSEQGSCIDCGLCVQVCPTGIDIRNGLQYECIGCALCIDACDSVMDKIGEPRGLVRYTTENELEGKTTHRLRPRLVGYGVAMVLMVTAFTALLATRAPVDLAISRDRGQLFTEAMNGDIVNNFTLSVLNKTPVAQTYEVAVLDRPGAKLEGPETVEVASGERLTFGVAVSLAPSAVVSPRLPFEIEIHSLTDTDVRQTIESTFIGPSR